MRRIFWGFCRNWFLMSPLHYLSSRSDFGFEFSEIFVFEKRLPDSTIRGVGDSPTQRYGESFFEYEYLREFEAKIGMAGNVVQGT